MMQSEFNFDVWFVIYRFLKLQITLDENAIITFEFFLHAYIHPPIRTATPTRCSSASPGVMVCQLSLK
jgi:hypothetical protein